eukprot:COSAG01_NODE_14030_length_1505_cov_1.227596_2_plen_66_part_01
MERSWQGDCFPHRAHTTQPPTGHSAAQLERRIAACAAWVRCPRRASPHSLIALAVLAVDADSQFQL